MFVKVLMTTCQIKYTEDGKNISIKIKIYPQYSIFFCKLLQIQNSIIIIIIFILLLFDICIISHVSVV